MKSCAVRVRSLDRLFFGHNLSSIFLRLIHHADNKGVLPRIESASISSKAVAFSFFGHGFSAIIYQLRFVPPRRCRISQSNQYVEKTVLKKRVSLLSRGDSVKILSPAGSLTHGAPM